MRIILIFLIFSVLDNTNSEDKCKDNNEYCQNHWECCSNSCLSYVYRCVGTPKKHLIPVNPMNFLQTKPENIDEKIVTLDNLIQNVFATMPAELTTEKLEPSQNLLQNRIQIDSVLEKTSTESATTCLEIGQKCYYNNVCCSKRCHGFLHQCVN